MTSATSNGTAKAKANRPMNRSLKGRIQAALKRAGLYQRVKSSSAYDLYWKVFDKRLIEQRNNEVNFYRRTLKELRKGDVVFDIGANQGQKTDIFLRLGAQVVAVDPDPANQVILKERFLKYRVNPKPVTIVGKAVSDSVAIQTFWVDAPGSAKNTLNPKWVETLRNDEGRFGEKLEFAEQRRVETTTLEELIKTYGIPAFVKIDVEGHEPSVLRGLKRPIPCLSFEVNLPEFRLEGVQCLELLAGVAPEGEFNYADDCQHGLALDRWLPMSQFIEVFKECRDPSIEVFWRCSQRR